MNVRRAVALGVAAAATAMVVITLRGARAEWRVFRPRRVVVSRPASLAAIPAIRDVQITSGNGSRVAAWWIPSRNGAAVVLAHGSNGSRMDVAAEAAALEAKGFGALLFDWPGNGDSEGSVNYGAPELLALRSAVSFVESQPDVDPKRIGGLGLSVGAALVAVGAAHDPCLRALAIIGAFTDSEAQTRYEYRRFGALGALGPLWVDRYFMQEPLRPMDAAPALAGRAVLYITGADDPVIPVEMARALRDASGPRAELWIVPGGTHLGFDEATSGAYSTRIVTFFESALAAP